jgi:hypothetical protein
MSTSALIAVTLALAATSQWTDSGYNPPPRGRKKKPSANKNKNEREHIVAPDGNRNEGEEMNLFLWFGTDVRIGSNGLKRSGGKDTTRGPVEESRDGVAGEKDVGGSIKEKKKRNFWRRLRELFGKRA